jgi:SP family myo-inositol transporter-like MFS transporter 13
MPLASTRGKGTGIFQWMLTLGIFAAALVGIYYSYRVQAVAATATADALLVFKDHVWRRIFWVSMPPGALFVIGSLMVTESPRWLFRRGKKEQAYAVLLRSRSEEQAKTELREMEETAQIAVAKQVCRSTTSKTRSSAANTSFPSCWPASSSPATPPRASTPSSSTTPASCLQSGLSDIQAHWGYVALTLVNFLMTMVGMLLVDRKGRRFLLITGTSGIMISMIAVGLLFLRTEKKSIDAGSASAASGHGRSAAQRQIRPRRSQSPARRQRLFRHRNRPQPRLLRRHLRLRRLPLHHQLRPLRRHRRFAHSIKREDCVPANSVESFFKNPFRRTSPPPEPRRSGSKRPWSAACPSRPTAGWSRSAATPSWPPTPWAPASASGWRSQS